LTIGPADSTTGDHHRHLEFIEVGVSTEAVIDDGPELAPVTSNEPGWSLWGDADR
jgi:hypothetical protein